MSERKYTVREESMRGVIGWLNTHGYEYRDGGIPTRIVIELVEKPKLCEFCKVDLATVENSPLGGGKWCRTCGIMPLPEDKVGSITRVLRARGILREGL